MRWLLLGAAIVTAVIFNGRNIRAQLSLTGEGWDRLHPDLQRIAKNILRDAARAGLHVGVFEGYRTRERQQDLMGRGRSWVGDADNSYHRWGLAVDFVFLDRLGQWTWEPDGGLDDWHRLGEIIERNGLTWGGRWKTFDGPHAQYDVLHSIASLRAAGQSPESVSWV